jgi:uncharacterized membrane protein YfcA
VLDVAFVDTRLSKRQIIATKATSQMLSHSLKLAYFVPLMSGSEVPPGALLGILLATVLGTWAGTRIMERLSERRFRLLSRYLVYSIGLVYLCKAALL